MHLDEEVLAQWALEGSEPEPDAADHLATCSHCQTALAELRELSAGLHEAPDLATPPAQVWDRISADLDLTPTTTELGRTTAATTSAGTTQPGSTSEPGTAATQPASSANELGSAGDEAGVGRRRGYGRGVLTLAAGVAVVLGIGIGLGAGGLLGGGEELTPTPPPVAVVQLDPLPGKTGSGTADLIQSGSELKVSVTGLDAQTGYYELWLINADGERMVSLGILDPGQAGTFRIPGDLTGQGYRIIDVSLEPSDGNPVHSRDSIVRGTLPS